MTETPSLTISVPVSNMFTEPSAEAEHSDELMFGTAVEVIDRLKGFALVVTDYGYKGWISEADMASPAGEANRTVILPWADLLPDDRNFHAPVMSLPFGSNVCAGFSEQFPRHAFVVLPDKRMYYIRKEALGELPAYSPTNGDRVRGKVLETAKSFLGVQYRWGGRTYAGIDCSGLVFTAYRAVGITVWRDAIPDKTPSLRQVPIDEVKPADLLFFKGHVGLSLGGKKFIHASSGAAKTAFASFDPADEGYSEWFAQNYICAGTVL